MRLRTIMNQNHHPPSWFRSSAVFNSALVPELNSVPQLSPVSKFISYVKGTRNLVQTQKRNVQNAVIVGVHGYFPAKLTQKVLGTPTGTSRKFVNEARKVCEHECPNVNITEICLEGEGLIGNRIVALYDQLMKFKHDIMRADLVMFVGHSQGSVVSVGLANLLIGNKLMNLKKQDLTLLCMAGTFLGPMPGVDKTLAMKAISRFENASLIELFELQKLNSLTSMNLQQNLSSILHNGAKMVLVGSADDQLVPLYSSLMVNVAHPNIFRSIYLDSAITSSNGHQVLMPLLSLACMQLNNMHTDHGVLRELSALLAGQYVSGGHSNLYNFQDIYKLAFDISTKTNRPRACQPTFTEYDINYDIKNNPYVLPYAVRALVSDNKEHELVKTLLNEFNEWRPHKKQLKDLKWRLGGLRSKL